MIKKILITTLLIFSTPAMGGGLAQSVVNSASSNMLDINAVSNNLYKDSVTLLNMSASVLKMSQILLESQQNGRYVNTDYVASMLRLSDDIGRMADRILDTEKEIGQMSDRILETQKIQSQNLALTQRNILSAQQNLSAILNSPNNCK